MNIGVQSPLSQECINCTSQLKQLTSLSLSHISAAASLSRLPTSLLDLQIGYRELPASVNSKLTEQPQPIDIAHLQQLKKISVNTVYRGNELLALRKLPDLQDVALAPGAAHMIVFLTR